MADIYMYEDVEPGLADRIVSELKQAGGEDVTLHVNSYGGDVFEGKTVMHQLRKHEGAVTAIVEGVAASAASFIVAGGATRVIMAKGSRMMVHNALSMAFGNANELDRLSEQLRGQSQDIAEIYAERSGKPVDEWLAAMDDETWFTAEQAVTAGLADAVEEFRVTNNALRSFSRVANLFKNQVQAPPRSLLEPATQESGDKPTTPSDGQEGDAMSIKNLAQELGVEPDVLREKLSNFFNEEVSDAVEAAPEELADGVEDVEQPEPGEAQPEPGEAQPEPGEHEEVSEEEAEEPAEVEQPAEEDGERPDETVTIDAATYAELKAAAEHGWAAAEEKAKAERAAEVDNWISEGRISAALRSKAVAAIERDADAARATYGSNPKGTIPRSALGHAVDEVDEKSSSSHLSNSANASGLFGAPTF